MSQFPIFHGISLANNSWIENLHLESLTQDPQPADPGRLWFNTTTRKMRFSTLDATGGVAIHNLVVPEDFAEQLANSKQYTDEQITALVGGAPGVLDTLKELSTALGDDANFASTIANSIATQIAAAKDELKGSVTEAFDSFAEVEQKLNELTIGQNSVPNQITNAIGPIQTNLSSLYTTVTDVLTPKVNTNTDDIAIEKSRATAVEGVLREDLDQEIQDRIAGDATNAANITAEETRALGVEGVLRDDLTTETNTRISAITAVNTSLTNETNARTAADTALDGKITEENARATAAEGVLRTDLAAEALRAQQAETGFGTAISNEITRAMDAEGVLRADLAAEVTTRGSADTALDGKITEEKDRATAAEGVLRTDLAAEVINRDAGDTATLATAIAKVDEEETRATGVESGLRTDLDSEISRATAADLALGVRIDNMMDNTDPAALDSLKEIVTAFQAADSSIFTALNTMSAGASGAVTVEKERAEAAELVLTQNLNAEIQNRIDGDAAAMSAVTEEETRALGVEGELREDLDQEILDRIAGDTNALTSAAAAVAAEKERAELAETAMDSRVTGIESQVNGKIGTLSTLTTDNKITIVAAINEVDAHSDAVALSVTVERERALAAEAQAVVTANAHADAVATAAQTAAQTYADGIVETERNARIAGDAGAMSAVTAEETRAKAAELVLTNGLATEVADRIAADAANATAISNETTARTDADTAIRTSYNARIFTFQSGVAANTHIINHNLNADFVNFTVLVERENGSWRNDIVSVEETDKNTLKIYLATSVKVKVSVQSMTTI